MLGALASFIRPLFGDPQRDTGPVVVELRARYESLAGEPSDAAVAVDAWLKLDETNPDAQLCAFCARGRQGPENEQQMNDALVPGAEALQLTLDPDRVNSVLERRLEAQLGRTPEEDPSRHWLQKMLTEIRSAAKDG